MHLPFRTIFTRGVLLALFLSGAASASAQSLLSETFNNGLLDSRWTFESPNPGSTLSSPIRNLNIVAGSGNGGSDLDTNFNYAAPRLLQRMSPILDYTMETKFDLPPGYNLQAAGLLLAMTNGIFTADTDFLRIAERSFSDAGPGIRSVGSNVAFNGITAYLRVQKSATNYTGWYSSDGINWILNGTTVMTNEWRYAGLYVISQPMVAGTNNFNASASFYYFNASNQLPPLTMTTIGLQKIILSWSTNFSSYLLQTATNVATFGVWQDVPTARVTNGNIIIVTNDFNLDTTLYRLRSP